MCGAEPIRIIVLLLVFLTTKSYLVSKWANKPQSKIIFNNHGHTIYKRSTKLSASFFQSEDTETVLKLVRRTDRGTQSTPQLDTNVSEWIQLKSAEYKKQNKLAKNDINLFGNFDVTYVSSGKNESGQPAGGAFRGKFGKIIFQSDKVYQNIIKNEIKKKIQVINIIKGKILYTIPFRVILYGIATYLNESDRNLLYKKYNRNVTESCVRADFESPLICFGNEWNKYSFSLKIGPKSRVVLDTPYVDERIRLGVGGRGSQFIFTRTYDMMANEWLIWREQKKPVSAKRIGVGLILTGILFNLFEILFLKIAALLRNKLFSLKSKQFLLFSPGTILAVIGSYLLISKGGLLRGNQDDLSN